MEAEALKAANVRAELEAARREAAKVEADKVALAHQLQEDRLGAVQKQLSELVIFVTPIVVDNPDENDENFNAEDVRRLEELSKPLDDMAADLVGTTFFDRMEDEEDEDGSNGAAEEKTDE